MGRYRVGALQVLISLGQLLSVLVTTRLKCLFHIFNNHGVKAANAVW